MHVIWGGGYTKRRDRQGIHTPTHRGPEVVIASVARRHSHTQTTDAHTPTRTHAHTHARTHARTHTHTHAHTYTQVVRARDARLGHGGSHIDRRGRGCGGGGGQGGGRSDVERLLSMVDLQVVELIYCDKLYIITCHGGGHSPARISLRVGARAPELLPQKSRPPVRVRGFAGRPLGGGCHGPGSGPAPRQKPAACADRTPPERRRPSYDK